MLDLGSIASEAFHYLCISIVGVGMAEVAAEFSEGFNTDHQGVFQNTKWQGLAMYHILESKFQAWKPHSF